MNVKQELTEANKVKLTIELTAEEFEEGMAVSYKKNVGKISIPGFRKGKAPRKIIESFYGESIFYEEAFNHCFPKAYEQAVEENKLFPVEQPEIDILQIGRAQNTVFTATFFVKPEVILGQYQGIEIQKPSYPITEAQVTARIDRDRERTARWVDVDRPCKMGDRATIDYKGTVDGEAFEGGTSENFPLELGSGTFIPGFEDQVAGMQKGEEKDVSVTFPEDYRAENLAGKQAVFHVTLHGVQEKELSELDDEFAKDVSDFETFAEYKASIERELSEQAKEREDNEFASAVVEGVAKNAQVDIPAPMVEREIDAMLRDMEMRFSYQGLKMEDFYKYTGQTPQQVREQYRESALARVKSELVLEAVREAEKIEADEADVNALIEKYAKQSGTDTEKFTARFTERDWEYIRTDAATQKTIAFLKSVATPVEKQPEPEEKPAQEEPKAE